MGSIIKLIDVIQKEIEIIEKHNPKYNPNEFRVFSALVENTQEPHLCGSIMKDVYYAGINNISNKIIRDTSFTPVFFTILFKGEMGNLLNYISDIFKNELNNLNRYTDKEVMNNAGVKSYTSFTKEISKIKPTLTKYKLLCDSLKKEWKHKLYLDGKKFKLENENFYSEGLGMTPSVSYMEDLNNLLYINFLSDRSIFNDKEYFEYIGRSFYILNTPLDFAKNMKAMESIFNDFIKVIFKSFNETTSTYGLLLKTFTFFISFITMLRYDKTVMTLSKLHNLSISVKGTDPGLGESLISVSPLLIKDLDDIIFIDCKIDSIADIINKYTKVDPMSKVVEMNNSHDNMVKELVKSIIKHNTNKGKKEIKEKINSIISPLYSSKIDTATKFLYLYLQEMLIKDKGLLSTFPYRGHFIIYILEERYKSYTDNIYIIEKAIYNVLKQNGENIILLNVDCTKSGNRSIKYTKDKQKTMISGFLKQAYASIINSMKTDKFL